MELLEEIEQAIVKLPDEKLTTLSKWLENYMNEKWDKEIASASSNGPLAELAKKALKDYDKLTKN